MRLMRFLMIGLAVMLSIDGLAINTVDTGYQIGNGSNATIDAFGTCQVVTNNTGRTIFVSTRTANEWNSFLNHLPANVAATPGCVIVSGCMRLTGATTCNSYCASLGRTCISVGFDADGTNGAMSENTCQNAWTAASSCGSVGYFQPRKNLRTKLVDTVKLLFESTAYAKNTIYYTRCRCQ